MKNDSLFSPNEKWIPKKGAPPSFCDAINWPAPARADTDSLNDCRSVESRTRRRESSAAVAVIYGPLAPEKKAKEASYTARHLYNIRVRINKCCWRP